MSEVLKMVPEVVNKANAIKEALIANPKAAFADIILKIKKEKNIEVTKSYISFIKFKMNKSKKPEVNLSFHSLCVARKLVREAGGFDAAYEALERVFQEHKKTLDLRQMYESRVSEIDQKLDNAEDPPNYNDRRDLLAEKKRIQKLIATLDGV